MSWGDPDIPGVVTKLAFLLGRPADDKKQEILEEESRKHRDIVQGDFMDTYHNLSYKAIMGNLWVSEFCDQAEFVVKTDDDMFIDLYEVGLMTQKGKRTYFDYKFAWKFDFFWHFFPKNCLP